MGRLYLDQVFQGVDRLIHSNQVMELWHVVYDVLYHSAAHQEKPSPGKKARKMESSRVNQPPPPGPGSISLHFQLRHGWYRQGSREGQGTCLRLSHRESRDARIPSLIHQLRLHPVPCKEPLTPSRTSVREVCSPGQLLEVSQQSFGEGCPQSQTQVWRSRGCFRGAAGPEEAVGWDGRGTISYPG